MEGTSGAADLEPLRGGSGEAALGPRRPRESGASRPRESGSRRATRSRKGPRGVIVGGVPYQLVPDSFRAGRPRRPSRTRLSIWCAPIARQEVSERIGLGQSSRHGPLSGGTSKHASRTRALPDGRRRAAKAGRPLARETSAGGARRAAWSLGSRRRASASQGADQRRAPITRIQWSAWRMASNPSGGSSKSSASWARRVDELGPGIGRSCGCARGLFWLQKSTRVTWSKPATATGNRRGKRWV
jgi:hypothetical protein